MHKAYSNWYVYSWFSFDCPSWWSSVATRDDDALIIPAAQNVAPSRVPGDLHPEDVEPPVGRKIPVSGLANRHGLDRKSVV